MNVTNFRLPGINLLYSVVMLLILEACDSQPVRVPVSQIGERGKFHQVRHGDTLYSIAWRYGQDYHDIAKLNGISKPYTIYVGQRVWLSRQQSGSQSTGKSRAVSKARTSKRNQGLVYKSKPKAAPTKTFVASQFDWQWPVRGKIIKPFSLTGKVNKGIDIKSKSGTAVHASAPGKVVYAGGNLRGYGKLVIIKHDEHFLSAYGNNQKLRVAENDQVSRGQVISEVGMTAADVEMLHFEIRRDGKPEDPGKHLPK